MLLSILHLTLPKESSKCELEITGNTVKLQLLKSWQFSSGKAVVITALAPGDKQFNHTTLALGGIQGSLNSLAEIVMNDRLALAFLFAGQVKVVPSLIHPAAF